MSTVPRCRKRGRRHLRPTLRKKHGPITTNNRGRDQFEVQCEYDFDKRILADCTDLNLHPVVQHSPLITGDGLHGGRTEAMRLQHKARDVETIQYVNVMSLYPYVCKYFKFPIGYPLIHVGDACQDMQAMLLKDGLMKCSILPPRRLFYPVLPF